MRPDFFDFKRTDVSDSEREGERIRILARALLERAQRFLEDAAVDLDRPPRSL